MSYFCKFKTGLILFLLLFTLRFGCAHVDVCVCVCVGVGVCVGVFTFESRRNKKGGKERKTYAPCT